MKFFIKKIAVILLLFFSTVTVYAQAPSPSQPVDEVADLAFPIEELGGCEDFNSCMTFCDDPVNHASCMEYAKQQGFYVDDPVVAPTDDFLSEAEDALGCTGAEACAQFCGQEANFDACADFAESQGMVGGYVNEPDSPEIIEEAREFLECNDYASCRTLCENSANADRCSEFASQVGIIGGQISVGPGGCTSDETCGLFCSDPANFQACSQSVPEGGNFNGPGGCNSPEGCRTHCEENPNDCRSYAPGSNGVYVPASCPAGHFFGPGGSCTAAEKTKDAADCAQGGKFWNGSSCQDNPPPGIHPTVGGAYFQPRPEMGGCKNPGECYDFCRENPGKCSGFDSKAEKPKDDYIPSLYYTPGSEVKFAPKADMGGCNTPGGCYDYCKANPGSCQGFSANAPRPADKYLPLTYYTPPADYQYFTPPATSFYVTPMYYTPPQGSSYTTPSYYTPGTYSTPAYYTPFANSNYFTPSYYTPGTYYPTPEGGRYPTPTYNTPTYYTPPIGSNYTTPSYYTPATYTSPYYYTPGIGYSTPTYSTPPPYNTPQYYTPPYTGGNYTTPTYYTPPAGSNYTTPTYASPAYYYPSPTGSYGTPSSSPGYSYPTPASGTYPTPSYAYPSPSGTGADYFTPNSSYSYPSPTDGYSTPSPMNPYSTPPNYSTPTYSSPPPYGTPEYSSPPPYGTPEYSSPPPYGTPPPAPPPSVQGISTTTSVLQSLLDFLSGK